MRSGQEQGLLCMSASWVGLKPDVSVSLSEFAYFMRLCAGSTNRSVRTRPVSGGEASFIAVRPHSVQAGCTWGSMCAS